MFTKQTASFLALLFSLVLMGAVTSCKKDEQNQPEPMPQIGTILINGKEYATVTVGNQIWTATNYEGTGGVAYRATNEKPEYGRYYTYEEVKAITLPSGWRLPTVQDYKRLAESQGLIFSGDRATAQEASKKLVSKTNWRTVPGTNASGFNAYPAGYMFRGADPIDGDISEFWTVDGHTFSILESANGKAHNITFYKNSDDPEYRFNVRFIKTN
ncbi:hypothetical protein GCM10027341_24030 [Spirosoma knui]